MTILLDFVILNLPISPTYASKEPKYLLVFFSILVPKNIYLYSAPQGEFPSFAADLV